MQRLHIVILLLALFTVQAPALAQVDDFIQKVKTVSYDCPVSDYFEQLDAYLAQDNLTDKQRFELSVEKAQFLICDGKASDAQALLYEQITTPNLNKTSTICGEP